MKLPDFQSIKQKVHGLLGKPNKQSEPERVTTTSSVASISITYRCQLSCPHCGSELYKQKGHKDLTYEEIKTILRELPGVGVKTVLFFGGEPLLHENLCEFIAYAKEQGLRATIDSNAVALTPEYAKRLADAGLDMIYVSLDSSRPEVHDRLRNYPGLFNHVIDSIRLCQKIGLPVRISSYVDREKLNNGDIKELIDIARKMNVMVRILTVVLCGKMADEESAKFTPEEIKRFKSMLEPGVAYWEQDSCSSLNAPFICAARTKETLNITAYGDVLPCMFVPLTFGNIRKEPFTKIVERMWSHEMFDHKACSDCIMNTPGFRENYFDKYRGRESYPHTIDN